MSSRFLPSRQPPNELDEQNVEISIPEKLSKPIHDPDTASLSSKGDKKDTITVVEVDSDFISPGELTLEEGKITVQSRWRSCLYMA